MMKAIRLELKNGKALALFVVLFATTMECQAQAVQEKTKARWGATVGTQYNYKLLHNAVTLTLEYKDSKFFIGPEHTHFFSDYYDFGTRYEKNSLGLCLGYNYTFKTMDKISFYLQTVFSAFPSKYSYYQMGLGEWVQHNEWVVQNTASIGILYKLGNNVRVLLDGGFGSLQGFFLMLDTFIPSISLSLEFHF